MLYYNFLNNIKISFVRQETEINSFLVEVVLALSLLNAALSVRVLDVSPVTNAL